MRTLSLSTLLLACGVAAPLAAQDSRARSSVAPDRLAYVGARTAPAPATPAAPRNLRYGLKAGLISSGEAYVEEVDSYISIDGGVGIEGFLDYALAPRFSGGLYLDVDQLSIGDTDETLSETGVTMKATVGDTTRRVTFHPMLGIGYARVAMADAGRQSLSFLTLRAGPEVRVHTASGHTWVAELLVYAAPTGGNDELTVSFGPMMRVRAGMVF